MTIPNQAVWHFVGEKNSLHFTWMKIVLELPTLGDEGSHSRFFRAINDDDVFLVNVNILNPWNFGGLCGDNAPPF
jgi:hypothetical protein